MEINWKCKCRKLTVNSSNGVEVTYVCNCRKTIIDIKLNKNQRTSVMKSIRGNTLIHDLFHKFQDEFMDGLSFKYQGYDLMKRVRKFADKNKEIVLTSCDDNHHSGSLLVLIPHEDKYKMWGTTVIVIPQNGGKPVEFFLYPDHLKDFINAFQKMASLTRKHGNKNLSQYWSNKKEGLDIFDMFDPIKR